MENLNKQLSQLQQEVDIVVLLERIKRSDTLAKVMRLQMFARRRYLRKKEEKRRKLSKMAVAIQNIFMREGLSTLRTNRPPQIRQRSVARVRKLAKAVPIRKNTLRVHRPIAEDLRGI